MADNPQAFPAVAPRDPELSYPTPGMTLLDYFAGQALASMTFIKGDGSYTEEDHTRGTPQRHAEWVAKASYRIAAAMLNERQSHEG